MIATLALLLAVPSPTAPLPDCAVAALSLGTDGEGGAFDGMSHSGTLLVVRNIGSATCRVAGLPVLTFVDAKGLVLPIRRQASPGLHPGPVVLPVALAPGAEATAPLRWVSGPVYDKGRCYTPAGLRIAIGGATLGTAAHGPICGPAGGAMFEQPPLHADPVIARPVG